MTHSPRQSASARKGLHKRAAQFPRKRHVTAFHRANSPRVTAPVGAESEKARRHRIAEAVEALPGIDWVEAVAENV
ncbi:hypothetical protein AB0R12_24775, partial [Streptomyces niveus]|uniref:hypothetical protein n=1 Tax=Streptomyces niveus TaxID=193462 RepID=UPI003423F6BA